eukprot:364937-Chlamydomonas_euryale.AAC.20
MGRVKGLHPAFNAIKGPRDARDAEARYASAKQGPCKCKTGTRNPRSATRALIQHVVKQPWTSDPQCDALLQFKFSPSSSRGQPSEPRNGTTQKGTSPPARPSTLNPPATTLQTPYNPEPLTPYIQTPNPKPSTLTSSAPPAASGSRVHCDAMRRPRSSTLSSCAPHTCKRVAAAPAERVTSICGVGVGRCGEDRTCGIPSLRCVKGCIHTQSKAYGHARRAVPVSTLFPHISVHTHLKAANRRAPEQHLKLLE